MSVSQTSQRFTLWEFFQSLGKTFMLPVALLSFCGIMLGIGSSLSSRDVTTLYAGARQRQCCSWCSRG
jgi:PTS system maltose and glucose-specific IIC component